MLRDGMMKKRAGIVILVLISILGFGGYLYWKYIRSPKYSLLQARKAFEQHDIESFEKYVDIEGVIGNAVDQILEVEAQKQEPEDEWERLGKSFGIGLVSLMKPQLIKLYKEQVVKLVESGNFKGESKTEEKAPSSLSGLWNRVRGKNNFPNIAYIKKNGKLAYVGLNVFDKEDNAHLILELKMRNKGNYWQVAEISNLGKYIKKTNELEEQRIANLNKPIIEKIRNTLVLKSFKKYTKSDEWDLDKKVFFELKFQNIGKKKIGEYEGVLTCRTSKGKLIKKLPFKDTGNISIGGFRNKSLVKDINDFDVNDALLYKTPQSGLKISVEIKRIKFSDGEELKLYHKQSESM